MTAQQKKAVETTREALAATMGDEETTEALLMRSVFEFMHAQNRALNPKASPRGLMARFGIKLQLANGGEVRRNLYQQYEICARKCEHLETALDGKAVLDLAVAEGLLSRTYRGFVGLPGAFSGGPDRPDADAL